MPTYRIVPDLSRSPCWAVQRVSDDKLETVHTFKTEGEAKDALTILLLIDRCLVPDPPGPKRNKRARERSCNRTMPF